MSRHENSLDFYVEQRMIPFTIKGMSYTFRNNSFSGKIQRYDGSTGFIKNSARGTPDRILLFKGRFVGLEFKTVTGRQSPEQKLAQEQIEEAGGIYRIIRSSEDFEKLLKELLASSTP